MLPRLRECCLGSGHPVGQLAVEGRVCRLRGQARDVVPLGVGGVDPDRSGRAGAVQAGDEALQRGDVELVGAGPARPQLDVKPPRRDPRPCRAEGRDEAEGVGGTLLAVNVRAGVGQQAVTSTVGPRGADTGPVRK